MIATCRSSNPPMAPRSFAASPTSMATRSGFSPTTACCSRSRRVKGAHFIELCDQRDVPLLFLQNITGFMVGVAAERSGIAKHSAKLVYAVSNARTAKFTVVIGGSYGAGNYGMCGRGFRPRLMFAWPNARIATMSADVGSTVVTELRRQSISRGAVDEAELQRLEAETRRAVRGAERSLLRDGAPLGRRPDRAGADARRARAEPCARGPQNTAASQSPRLPDVGPT